MAKRKIDLFYLPKFLIISLKRFSNIENQLIKDRQYIDFPIKDMDLSEYVLGPEKKNLNMIYMQFVDILEVVTQVIILLYAKILIINGINIMIL